jgi:ABC-type sugar transport system ATPase subunit
MDLYRQPVNRFVAEFLGSPKINVMPYELLSQDCIQIHGQSMAVNRIPQKLMHLLKQGHALGVRPESIRSCVDHVGIRASVEFVENLGDVQMLYLNCEAGAEPLRMKASKMAVATPVQTELMIDFDWEQVLVFDLNGSLLQ